MAVNGTYADITGDEGVFHGIDGVIPASYPACPTEAPAPTDAPAPTAPEAKESGTRVQVRPLVAMIAGSIVTMSCALFL